MTTIFVCVALCLVVKAADPEWLLLLSQDTTVPPYYFDAVFAGSGENNAEDPTANLFSIIGGLPSAQYESYKNDEDKYQLRLIYNKGLEIDGVSWDYTWTQSTWVTASIIGTTDANFSPWGTPSCAEFYGLGLTSRGESYLDGDGDAGGCWYHSVGTITEWYGGIPVDNAGGFHVAQQSDAYVCMGGGCTDNSVITTCAKSTDGTYDCGYVACDPAECNDGNICNGEEACVDDICVSPDDFECDNGFVCDATVAGCVRDCDTLDIDGFLTDCSAEFADNEAELAGIQSSLAALTIQTVSLDNATVTNAADIDELDAATTARLDAIEAILNFHQLDGQGATVFYASFWEQNKDMMLTVMMLLNVALLLCLCMSWPKRSGKHVYAAVDYASDIKA